MANCLSYECKPHRKTNFLGSQQYAFVHPLRQLKSESETLKRHETLDALAEKPNPVQRPRPLAATPAGRRHHPCCASCPPSARSSGAPSSRALNPSLAPAGRRGRSAPSRPRRRSQPPRSARPHLRPGRLRSARSTSCGAQQRGGRRCGWRCC